MSGLHKRIANNLDTYITHLKTVYGSNLTHIGFWGTEPTLTLDKIDVLELLNAFPKLKSISFSTNLIKEPVSILEFIDKLIASERELEFKFQVSIDGPAFITDANRVEGATEKIHQHLMFLARRLNYKDLRRVKIKIPYKATLTMDNIRMLNRKSILIDDYFAFFDFLTSEFNDLCKKVKLEGNAAPSLVVPGKYTSNDGKELAKLFRHLRMMRYPNMYVGRLTRLLKYNNEIGIKPSMFTCSGGDSNLGVDIDGDVHICHRSFYFNQDEYIKSVLSSDNIENWDVSLFKKGRIKMMKKWFIPDVNKLTRFEYVMRNYHDFWRFKLSYVIAMLKELVYAGQANRCYLNDKMATVFALFVNSGLSCPAENLLNTGVVHLSPVSMIRLFANGAFEEMLNEIQTRK